MATEAGLSAIQRTGYGECWRPSTRLGISADYNVNNVFSMKSGLYYTFRGYSVNNGGTYSNGDATMDRKCFSDKAFFTSSYLG